MRLRGALPVVICACGFSPNAATQQTDAPIGPIDSPRPIDSPMIDAPMIDAPMIDAPIDAPWTPPGKPAVTVGAGDRKLLVSWTESDNGNPPATTYIAFATTTDGSAVGSGTCEDDTSPFSCTISPLTDGATYAVTVTATGSGGSATSDPVDATPIPDALGSSSLVLWLDARQAGGSGSAGSVGALATWYDLTSNHNDATQGTAGHQPTLGSAEVGGEPAVTFDGSDDTLTTPAFLVAGSAYTIVTVASDRAATGGSFTGIYSTMQCAPNKAGFNLNGYNNNLEPYLLDHAAANNTGAAGDTLRLDGSDDGTGATAGTIAVTQDAWFVTTHTVATAAGSNALSIGSYTGDCDNANASIGELLVFHAALGSGDIGALEEYATHKWQIPPPP